MYKILVVHGNCTFSLSPKESLSDAIKTLNQLANMLSSVDLPYFHAYVKRSRLERFIIAPVPFSEPGHVSLLVDDVDKYLK